MFLKAEALLAVGLLAVIVFLVFIAGVMRWFGEPLIWSVDLAQLLFVWVSFLGADMALRKRAHIGIDYLVRRLPRSEEHTSELQSLMRISYAVFCLKKKTNTHT